MNKETFIENMDKYIDGKLSTEQIVDFETILNNDPSMKKELDLHIKTREAIVIQSRIDKLKELDQIRSQVKSEKGGNSNPTLIRRLLPLSIAAGFVVLMSAYFLLRNNVSENPTLIDTQFVDVSIKPDRGLLGAAPTKRVKLNIYCCGDRNEYEQINLSEYNLFLLKDKIKFENIQINKLEDILLVTFKKEKEEIKFLPK